MFGDGVGFGACVGFYSSLKSLVDVDGILLKISSKMRSGIFRHSLTITTAAADLFRSRLYNIGGVPISTRRPGYVE